MAPRKGILSVGRLGVHGPTARAAASMPHAPPRPGAAVPHVSEAVAAAARAAPRRARPLFAHGGFVRVDPRLIVMFDGQTPSV